MCIRDSTVVGAPYVKAEHYPIFDCAIGDRAIHYMGHVKMMGAVQPFISGAISKTVNLPEEITVDEISQLFIESWQLGIKAIAIYRDNCKVAQPLSKKGDAGATTLAPVAAVAGALPQRRRLPDDRTEIANASMMPASVDPCFATFKKSSPGRPSSYSPTVT